MNLETEYGQRHIV